MDRDVMASAINLKHAYPVNVAAATTTTTLTKGTAPAPPNCRGIRLHSVTRGVNLPGSAPNLAQALATYSLQIITNATTVFGILDRDTTPTMPIREWENPVYVPWGTDNTIKIQTDSGAVAVNDTALFILYSFY